MDNLVADFIINNNEPLEVEYTLEPSETFDCSFEIYASGVTWGNIAGTIEEQTDFLEKMPEYSLELYNNKKMKTDAEIAKTSLKLVLPRLSQVSDWQNSTLFEELKNLATDNNLKNGQILYPLRIALSGKETTSGGATEIAAILGKDETMQRIKDALQKLGE